MGEATGLLFRQLLDPETSTWSYLLADRETREAVLIDAVLEQLERDLALLRELDLTLRWALETHVHADHVTASGRLRQELGARIAVSAPAGVRNADLLLADGDVVRFGRHALEVAAHARAHQRLRELRLPRGRPRLHRRRAADPRLRPHRLPAGRRPRAVPLRARADLLAPGRHAPVPGPRLQGPHGDDGRRGEALEPAPRPRAERGRVRGADGRVAAGLPEAHRRGRAGQPRERARDPGGAGASRGGGHGGAGRQDADAWLGHGI
jgi:hypothetical protein